MPYDLAQSLQSLGVAAELGMEIQSQIAAGTGNFNRLLEGTLVPEDAKNLAAGITAGNISATVLAEGSVVPAVAVLIAKAVSTPFNTVAPVITGTAQVGQTLTSTTGTWKGVGNTYARRWTADNVTIPGATAATYVPVIGDIGKVIRVVVSATNTSGTASATSSPTAAVIAA
jgi:hypothetical protein